MLSKVIIAVRYMNMMVRYQDKRVGEVEDLPVLNLSITAANVRVILLNPPLGEK